ncbi:MAG: type II and III secretion system protein family protein [Pseudomonadota bacterium]
MNIIRLFSFVAAASSLTLGGIPFNPSAAAWTELTAAENAPVLTVNRGRSTVIEASATFSTIAVADPEIASVTATSNRSFFVRGKAPGWTTVLVYDNDGAVIELIQVNVALGLDALRQDLNTLLPSEDLKVLPVHDGVFIAGDITSAGAAATAVELAERYVPDGVANGLTVQQAQQVLLEVRFVEVERDLVREVGIGVNGSDPNEFSFFSDGDLISGLAAQASIIARHGFGPTSVDFTLNALEEKGVLRTLARPNLVALSGDTASFLAGGEFPVPIAQEDDVVTIEFREFGVSLAFSPTVLGEDMINLRVRPEVSALDTRSGVSFGGIEVPGLSVRRADTTVELRDGQSFAVAGLLQDTYTNDVRQTPWLGNVPVLGALFSSKRYTRNETELVIIITPRLVQPAASIADLATPLDAFGEPTETEFFLLDQTVVAHEDATF